MPKMNQHFENFENLVRVGAKKEGGADRRGPAPSRRGRGAGAVAVRRHGLPVAGDRAGNSGGSRKARFELLSHLVPQPVGRHPQRPKFGLAEGEGPVAGELQRALGIPKNESRRSSSVINSPTRISKVSFTYWSVVIAVSRLRERQRPRPLPLAAGGRAQSSTCQQVSNAPRSWPCIQTARGSLFSDGRSAHSRTTCMEVRRRNSCACCGSGKSGASAAGARVARQSLTD